MKLYEIYWHPYLKIEAVKQGWSWPAFFFCWIWAFVKKMWGIGICLLAVVIFILIMETHFKIEELSVIDIIITIIIGIVFGMNGNTWRVNNLQKRGFEHKDTVTALTPEGAIAIYIKQKDPMEDTTQSDS